MLDWISVMYKNDGAIYKIKMMSIILCKKKKEKKFIDCDRSEWQQCNTTSKLNKSTNIELYL